MQSHYNITYVPFFSSLPLQEIIINITSIIIVIVLSLLPKFQIKYREHEKHLSDFELQGRIMQFTKNYVVHIPNSLCHDFPQRSLIFLHLRITESLKWEKNSKVELNP